MKYVALAVLLVSVALGQEKPDSDVAARIDQTARYFTDDGLFAGVVLVARGDQVIFHKAYGYANYEWKTPNTPDTIFRIASLTKQFTATAILMLEQRARLEKMGDLKVEDPLKKYIPNIPASWNEITLQHLLTHTSGITPYTTRKRHWSEPLSLDQMIDLVRDLPLDFKPGTDYRYDNSGYFLLGAVIEKASGIGYAKFLDENIFTPLGMHDTGYDDPNALVPRRATGHNRLGPGEYENASFMDMSVPYAAGALHSSARDLLKWNRALYGGDLIDAVELAKMTTPVLKEAGFGLVIDEDHGRRRYSHSGGINGFNSYLAYFPEDKLTVICLSNTKSPTTRLGTYIAQTVHDDPMLLPKPVPVPAEVLRSYVGGYGDAKNPRVRISVQDGKLLVRTGGLVDYLIPESTTRFFDRTTAAELVFTPAAVSVLQNGKKLDFPRIPGAAPPPGLAGTWAATFSWKAATWHTLFTFDVKGNTFSGTLKAVDAAHGLSFTDGKIDGDRIWFSISEQEKGQSKPQVTSLYTGTLEGDHLRLIYRNVEPRKPGLSPKDGGNIHLILATRSTP